jgi:streptogramin lyase
MRRGLATILSAMALVALAAASMAGATTNEAGELTQAEGPYRGAGAITAGPEGAIWFVSGKGLGRLAPDGTVTETPLSEQLAAREIIAGPEGDLWIARKDEVDRITRKGEVTRHPAPIEGKVRHLAFDAHGRLWFTVWNERWSHRLERPFGKAYVVRIAANGKMRTVAVPGDAKLRDEDLGGVSAAPGGGVWFTDPSLDHLGEISAGGKLTEFPGRIRPQVIVRAAGGSDWVIGNGGVGTIEADGKVRVLRGGTFEGYGIGGGSYGAAVDGRGDLWWIGEVTRVMRMTPAGVVSVMRGPGAPGADSIAAGSDGSIWVSTALGSKGAVEAPILRYQGGERALEVRSGKSVVEAGRFSVGVACGGAAGSCAGSLTLYDGRGHRIGGGHYSVGAEAVGEASVSLKPAARKELAKDSYLGATVASDEDEDHPSASAGIVLTVPQPRSPRAGRPLILPLLEGETARNPVFGPGGDIWFGSGVGSFGRLTTDGRLVTVKVPGLAAVPRPIPSQSRRYVWFTEEHETGFTYRGIEPVIGRVDAAGHLHTFPLPAGPGVVEDGATVARDGTVWVTRDDYAHHRAELDRLSPDGKVKRYPIGVETGPLLAGPHGGVWFAGKGATITHIGTDGRRRSIHLSHGGYVGGLAFGRDGSVWFTHGERRRLPSAIGHISRSGRVSERPTPDAAYLGPIVVDRRGRIWWAQDTPSRIGRLTPGGKPTLTRRGAAAGGWALLGPEGGAWFTAGYEDQVAIFHP